MTKNSNRRARWSDGFEIDQVQVAPSQKTVNVIEEGKKITHLWYKIDDIRQQYVQYAYDVWGIDLVLLMECENGQRNPATKGDWGVAHGFCQINTNYHTLPTNFFEWKSQIEFCNKKMVEWTPFYWPSRNIDWQKCYEYVNDRFKID